MRHLMLKFLLNRVEAGVSDGNVIAVTVHTLQVVFIPNLLQTVVQIISYANVRPASRRPRPSERTDMLPDLSRTKHTILCPICSNENVGVGGCVVIGVVFLKSSESRITSHVLRRLHLWFCRFGASLLWFFSVQNSTT